MKFKVPNINMNRPSGVIGIFAAVIVIGLVIFWVMHHPSGQEAAKPAVADPPTVAVATVTRQDLYKEDTVPAEFRPYVEVELHAKVSGYVKQMNVDFGDKVKAGELIATLEVPELQDELHNAQATEQKAEADHINANLIYTRLVSVNKAHPNLVAQQDLDTAEANDHSTEAAIAEAKAEVEKYQTLYGYTLITAPFDGVVTSRYADPGALIQAGTSSDTQSLPLVRVSDNYLLRLDFPVDVDYVQNIQVGQKVQVRVESLGNKTFTGTITRFTYDVDDKTRQMTTEIEVPNPNLELVPGMYAFVVLNVEKRPQALAVPVESVIPGAPPSVLVVDTDNRIEQRPVNLGLETSNKYEVLSGVKEGERVVVGNPSGFQAGQIVQTKPIQLSSMDEN
jgi:RND family efflux transporter MFP subunit